MTNNNTSISHHRCFILGLLFVWITNLYYAASPFRPAAGFHLNLGVGVKGTLRTDVFSNVGGHFFLFTSLITISLYLFPTGLGFWATHLYLAYLSLFWSSYSIYNADPFFQPGLAFWATHCLSLPAGFVSGISIFNADHLFHCG